MRYLTETIDQALDEQPRMAFVAGPRQVGKTTLARDLLRRAGCEALYFNWDVDPDRRAIVRDPTGFFRARLAVRATPRPPRMVLDEIHKYPRWKRLLKGLHDAGGDAVRTLVTGSGRLDIYQRGGDSLFGRYDLYRLHPFTVGELLAGGHQQVAEPARLVRALAESVPAQPAVEALRQIDRLGGFPDPLLSGREERLRRWRRTHRQLVVREDLRDLSQIRDLGLVESLVLLLPERIGSPLSLSALAQDLGVAFNTVGLWMAALARLYYLFEIRPYAGRLARTLRREGKVYLFDPTEIAEEGPRFENLVALHLQKLADLWSDLGHGDFALTYVRDREKREVDFLVTESRRPFLLVEAKVADTSMSPALRYFAQRLRPSRGAIQIVRDTAHPLRLADGLHVVPAAAALALM